MSASRGPWDALAVLIDDASANGSDVRFAAIGGTQPFGVIQCGDVCAIIIATDDGYRVLGVRGLFQAALDAEPLNAAGVRSVFDGFGVSDDD